MSETATRLQEAANFALHITEDYTQYFELGMPLFIGLLIFVFYRKKLNLAESTTYAFILFTLALEIPSMLTTSLMWWAGVGVLDFITFTVAVLYFSSFLGKNRVFHALAGTALTFSAMFLYMGLCLALLITLAFLFPTIQFAS